MIVCGWDDGIGHGEGEGVSLRHRRDVKVIEHRSAGDAGGKSQSF